MILAQLDEEARQTIILALTELRRRRPGWSEYLTTLINATFGGQVIADELDRLHDDLGAAYASTWLGRVERLELTMDALVETMLRLEQRDVPTAPPDATDPPRLHDGGGSAARSD